MREALDSLQDELASILATLEDLDLETAEDLMFSTESGAETASELGVEVLRDLRDELASVLEALEALDLLEDEDLTP